MEKKQSHRLYCHFFHAKNSCKKAERCDFIHGEKLADCPNGDRCPIKTPHVFVEIPKKPKRREEEGEGEIEEEEKVEYKNDAKRNNNMIAHLETKKVIEELEKRPPFENILNSFKLHLSSWDTPIQPDEKIPQEFLSKKSKTDKKSTLNNLKTASEVLRENKVILKSTENGSQKRDVKSNGIKSEVSKESSTAAAAAFALKEEKPKPWQGWYVPSMIADFGMKKFPKNVEAQTFLNNFWVLKEDMDHFKPVYAQFFERHELDLLFIVDCTGSMSSWIEAVKLEIEGIVSAVCNQHSGSIVRVGFVGYRDYGDTNRFEVADFTEDIQYFEAFLEKIEASGGNDAAEDVAGGFQKANDQSWRSKARHAVFLADAPAHGKEYHGQSDSWYDRYPGGDPDGVSLKNEVKYLVKKNVQLTALQITQGTELMFKMLKGYVKETSGQNMEVGKLGDRAQGFTQFIAESASKTLSMSYTKNTKENPNDAFFKALAICKEGKTSSSKDANFYYRFARGEEVEDTEESVDKSLRGETLNLAVKEINSFPASINGKEVPAICHTYFIVAENDQPINWRRPLVQNSSIHTSIKIESVPFAEGAMRYAFYAQDVKLKQRLVAKLSKKRYTSLEVEWKNIVKDLESQFICQHLVNQFNDRISEHVTSTANLKTFVHCFLYEIKDPDNKTSKYFPLYSAENYIEGKYEKFNNNSGWCNMSYDEPGLLSQALSHFTYQATLGYLMVVDLQGVGSYLTDPQIHCQDQHRFGAGNLGYQGIFKFFLTHACNRYCKALNLLHPSTTSKPPAFLPFFESEIDAPQSLTKSVYCICDLCKECFTTTSGFLYLKRRNGQEKYCPPCDTKRANSMKQATCTECNAKFRSSEYWFLMKRTDFPELCSQCRKERRERLRAQLLAS